MKKSIKTFSCEIEERGWSVFPEMLAADQVAALRADCLKWVDTCRDLQIAAGINANGDGTAHHSVGAGDSIDAFVDAHLFHDYMAAFFHDQPYIMHACNPVGGFPQASTYVHRIHKDVATFIPNYRLRINMLVMLDDFTLANGATQVLAGSHHKAAKPSEQEFDAQYESIVGKAGSVVLFNSYLWHRGGLNTTTQNRVALTLSFGPAFIKPQMDYARLIGEERSAQMSPLTRQVLGYNSRVPVSLKEWYRPRETRLYHADQG